MKHFTLLLTCLFLTLSFASVSQTKTEWIKLADNAYKKADYPTAINYYNKVLSDTANGKYLTLPYEISLYSVPVKSADTAQNGPTLYDYLIHQIANSYRLNWDYHTAARYYQMAAAKSNIYPQDKYSYGLVLMNIKKYNEAMDQFEGVSALKNASDSLKKQATHLLTSCYYSLDSNNVRKKVKAYKMDSIINTGTANFAAMYYQGNDKLIFTSARAGNTVSDAKLQDASFLCDLYTIERKEGQWANAQPYPKPINSPIHEGAAIKTLNEDLFFTRWTDANKTESAIYLCRTMDGRYFEPLKLGTNVNLPGYKSMHPFVTMDGTKLFFSSNRPGGKGGMDIWYCYFDENGTTSSPVCLSDAINTAGDEETPFFHTPSSTLFFSSDGHAGLGGLDIFKSAFSREDSVYSKPKNLGAPVNSSKDDAYFIIDRMQQHGFFTSDREDCPTGHCYDIYGFDNEPIYFDISGYVYDAETNKPIANAIVTLKDVRGNVEPIMFTTDEKGFYKSTLTEEMDYFIKAQNSGYFGDASSFATRGLTESKHFDQDFLLSKIPEGEIVIEGVEYDLNKTTLRPKSKEVLVKIFRVLQINDNLVIELSSHTDTRGSDEYNMKLSEGRAKSCVEYLLGKGIPPERLIARGYGETQPLVSDAEIEKIPVKEDKEAAHQKNRRTAFKVIGESKIKIITNSK